ncbi:hypothetical protein [Hoylesella timonensis]|uniref:Uncharacterized protein n=1 Tax=Hoylesella timonensis S9-PR14 TaxID=1401062 RepID=A0A098YVV2_9BACT|nr:hypothetical protein [Hoylesella timonensis]KGI22683.1 hypothetical protein HMPREF9304_03030 [Hoylesella timonensis S9-PR14]
MKFKTLHTLLLIIATTLWTGRIDAQQLEIDNNAVNIANDATLTGTWLKSGNVSWNAATKTLTLDNAKIENGTGYYTLLVSGLNITIKLIGSSDINATSMEAVRLMNSKTTITGGGALKVNAGFTAVYLHHDATLAIDGCTVDIDGRLEGWSLGDEEDKKNHLVVKNATLKATSVRRLSSITLTACKMQSPDGGKIGEDEFGKFVATADGSEARSIVIVPDKSTSIAHTNVENGCEVKAIYSMDGHLRSTLGNGINIVCTSDGKTFKVFKK